MRSTYLHQVLTHLYLLFADEDVGFRATLYPWLSRFPQPPKGCSPSEAAHSIHSMLRTNGERPSWLMGRGLPEWSTGDTQVAATREILEPPTPAELRAMVESGVALWKVKIKVGAYYKRGVFPKDHPGYLEDYDDLDHEQFLAYYSNAYWQARGKEEFLAQLEGHGIDVIEAVLSSAHRDSLQKFLHVDAGEQQAKSSLPELTLQRALGQETDGWLPPVVFGDGLLAWAQRHPHQDVLRVCIAPQEGCSEEFSEGAVYQYMSVPEDAYHALAVSLSRGSEYNARIKGRYRGDRLWPRDAS